MGFKSVSGILIVFLALFFALSAYNAYAASCCAEPTGCTDLDDPAECAVDPAVVPPNVILVSNTAYCSQLLSLPVPDYSCQMGCCCSSPVSQGNFMPKIICTVNSGTFHPEITTSGACSTFNCGTALPKFFVKGKALNALQQPVANAQVSISIQGVSINPVVSAADGSYTFNNIDSGSFAILTARNSSCSGTLDVYVNGNLNNQDIILSQCCTATSCTPWSACNNGLSTRTCYGTSYCNEPSWIESQSCSITLPQCGWTCTAWNPPSCSPGVMQRERICQKNYNTWDPTLCDVNNPLPKPDETDPCNNQPTAMCSDGIINQPSEECDVKVGSNPVVFASNCVPPYNTDIQYCTMDSPNQNQNCKCNYPPISQDDCTIKHTSENIMDVNAVPKEHALDIVWNTNTVDSGGTQCSKFIDHFELSYCERIGGATGVCNLVTINNNIATHTASAYNYKHSSSSQFPLFAEKEYCYNLTIVYNSSVVPPRIVHSSELKCRFMGNETCLNDHDASWCSPNPPPAIIQCDTNNVLDSEPCLTPTNPNPSCVQNNGVATCISNPITAICDQCNSVFGLFGYQANTVKYTLQAPPTNIQLTCPSLNSLVSKYNNNPVCYMDFSTTAVDKTYACYNVNSCYDYYSRGSCESDHCSKFQSASTNMCEWVYYSEQFNKGVCRPKKLYVETGKAAQHCDYCTNTKYNRIYPECTSDTCGLFGKCYYQTTKGTCDDGYSVTCSDYGNENDCIGTNKRNVIVNTTWSLTNPSNPMKANYTNMLLQQSNDAMQIGRCTWDASSTPGICYRDADNFTDLSASEKSDCYQFTDSLAYLRPACEHDTIAPVTLIQNRLIYGAIMDFNGNQNSRISITDNIASWTLNNPDNLNSLMHGKYIWMYYCIRPYPQKCYPNIPMTMDPSSPDKFKVKLDSYNPPSGIGQYVFYYFSEDPARNLETVKNFTFLIEKIPPVINHNISLNTYELQSGSNTVWTTDLIINISLLNEISLPVTCSFNLSPKNPSPSFLLWWTDYGSRKYDLPSSINPNNNVMNTVGRKISTKYPMLNSSVYNYNLTCLDDVGNIYEFIGSKTIDNDLTITDPRPIDKTYKYSWLPNVLSINTSADGSCRFTTDSQKTYDQMEYSFQNKNLVGGAGGHYIHTTTNIKAAGGAINDDELRIPASTKFYRFYIGCRLNINGQQKTLYGSDADIIDFAVDESAPVTQIKAKALNIAVNQNPVEIDPYVYDASQVWSAIDIKLSNNDSNALLIDLWHSPYERYFGANRTFFCLKNSSNAAACATPSLGFKEYNLSLPEQESQILLYYNTNASLKLLYGNYPSVCFYSNDTGGNIETIRCMRLNLRNVTFNTPKIIVNYTDENLQIPTIKTGFPVINVTYDESDVTLISWTLNDSVDTWDSSLISSSPDKRSFMFRTTYLPNGDYEFYINAMDSEGNLVNTTKKFKIDHTGMKIWLISPSGNDHGTGSGTGGGNNGGSDDGGEVGIGNSSPYNISVGSEFLSNCKYSMQIPAICQTPSNPDNICLYNAFFDQFTITGNSVIHKIIDFTPAQTFRRMYVVCKIDATNFNSNDPNSYGATSFIVGYDNTAPEILSITATENPVYDKNDRQTVITVSTDEDTVCHINGGNIPSGNPPPINTYFNNTGSTANGLSGTRDRTKYADYSTTQSIEISYWDYALMIPQFFKYNITCYNYAQLTDKEPYDVMVNYTDDIVITQKYPSTAYVNKANSVYYEIKTNVAVISCHLKLNNAQAFEPMTQNNPKNYSTTLTSLQQGVNNIAVKCSSGSRDATKAFTLSIDTIEPSIFIDAHRATCGLDGFSFALRGLDVGSGIAYYQYKVEEGSNIVKDWTTVPYSGLGKVTTVNFNNPLVEDATYKITAKSVDMAGNYKETTHEITAKAPNSISCDFIPPIIGFSNRTFKYHAVFNVTCNDTAQNNNQQSGCSAEYNYTLIRDPPYTCIDAVYDNHSTYDTLITLRENGLLCVMITDRNDNANKTQAPVSLELPECGNNKWEIIPNYYGLGDDYEEECDGTDIPYNCTGLGYRGGIISCYPKGHDHECTIDISNCNLGRGYCGDNITNNFPNEQCDGNGAGKDWGKITGCQSFGYNSSGTLTCNPPNASVSDRCQFNTTRCLTTLPTTNHCTSGTLATLYPGEQCESGTPNNNYAPLTCSDFDNFTGAGIACNQCMYAIGNCEPPKRPTVCGDGIWDFDDYEDCEWNNASASMINCSLLHAQFPEIYPDDFGSGIASCNRTCEWDISGCELAPKCGDNVANQATEVCDGNDLREFSCTNFGSLTNGYLRCKSDCTGFDFSNCNAGGGYCGDNLIGHYPVNGVPNQEQCDSNILPMMLGNEKVERWGHIESCRDFGFDYGNLTCNTPNASRTDMCMFNTTQCRNNITLPTASYACTSGLGAILDPGEQCERDTPNNRLAPLGCGSFNSFAEDEGAITCVDCKYNIQQCVPPTPLAVCNDSSLVTGEICDVPGTIISTCVENNPLLYISGNVTCSDNCSLNTDNCTIMPPPPKCGDNEINYGLNGDLEECDGYALNGMGCDSFLNWTNGTIGCYPSDAPENLRCRFDTRNCNKGGGYCGDNKIGHYVIDGLSNWEQCDGNGLVKDWGPIVNCTSFGFDSGTLTCNPATASRDEMCRFNTSKCFKAGSTNRGCTGGDTATLDKGEQCEPNGWLDPLTCSDFDNFTDEGSTISCYAVDQPLECSYNIRECKTPGPQPFCGDNNATGGEECDPAASTKPCIEINEQLYMGGTATCSATCRWITGTCILRPPEAVCGNGIVDFGEVCDTDAYGNYVGEATCTDFDFAGGMIKCDMDANCEDWDLDNCAGNLLIGYCGDNKTNNAPNEQCDGISYTAGDWGDIRTCQDFNFTAGSLKCNPPTAPKGTRCMFNTSQCIPRINNSNALCKGSSMLGGVTLDKGEQCEIRMSLSLECADFDNFTGGNISCTESCMYNIDQCTYPAPSTICGDGVISPDEECDGESKDCDEFPGFTGPVLQCGAPNTTNECHYDTGLCTELPRCGNGKIENIQNYSGPGQHYIEQCDITVGNLTCALLGYAMGGVLKCYPEGHADQCELDISNCDRGFGYCGDNKTNNAPNEQCDGLTYWSGGWGHITSCQDFGFTGGDLKCRECIFDTSACTYYGTGFGECNNPLRNSGEQCDPGVPSFNNLSCSDFDSFNNGTLTCGTQDNACMLNIADCNKINRSVCGDGNIDWPEHCDGTNMGLNPPTCQDWDPDAVSGTVKCFPMEHHDPELRCKFDFTDCYVPDITGLCGNGHIDIIPEMNYYESCDNTDLGGYNCSRFSGFSAGILSCNDDCMFDLSNCAVNASAGYCGDNKINNFEYGKEQCDGNDAGKDWGRIEKCRDFGFAGGDLRCNPPSASANDRCIFNTSQCTLLNQTNNVCVQGPGGTLSIGEQCEPYLNNPLRCENFDSFGSGTISCGNDCRYSIAACKPPVYVPRCNDGLFEPDKGEICDVPGSVIMTCNEFEPESFNAGNVICSSTCQIDISACRHDILCGNGIVDILPGINYYETCDGDNFNNYSCTDFGIPLFAGGLLNCDSNCQIDLSNCAITLESGYCGDHKINNFVNGQEQCDGNTWGNISGCTAFGFSPGQLRCNPPSASANDRCKFNTSACTLNRTTNNVCGGSGLSLSIGEQCDPSISNPLTCGNFDSFGFGDISCGADCRYNIQQCEPPVPPPNCNDGILEPEKGEQCQGENSIVATCDEFTNGLLPLGNVKCNSCRFNTSQCRPGPSCGNNIVEYIPELNHLEYCDGSVPQGINCSTIGNFNTGILRCFEPGTEHECTFDTGNCVSEGGYCGDNIINTPDEDCDGTYEEGDWGHIDSCTDLGFIGGNLSCSNCQFDTIQCRTNYTVPIVCGDGILSPGEDCEPSRPFNNLFCTDFDHYGGGILGCTEPGQPGIAGCQFDYSLCTPHPEPVCGDGYIDPGEVCDGTNLGNVTNCVQINPDLFAGGMPACYPPNSNDRCTFDTSGCVLKTYARCGDNIVNQPNEECDGSIGAANCSFFDHNIAGILRCNPPGSLYECMWDTSDCTTGPGYCGDGIVNNYYNEDCDGDDWGAISSCMDFGFTGGNLSCTRCQFNTTSCTTPLGNGTCNNHQLNPGEQCESDIDINKTCQDFDHYTGGLLVCNDCQLDFSGCDIISNEGYCGDNIINDFPDEECDGTSWGEIQNCTDFGFDGGTLRCSACHFNTSQCFNIAYDCGDGMVSGNEQCDGNNLRGMQCSDFGYATNWANGVLRCIPEGQPGQCTFDTSNCDKGGGYCGDNLIGHYPVNGVPNQEQCDGNDAGKDWGPIVNCTSFGFRSGTLTCNPNTASRADMCRFNTSQCYNPVSTGRSCDGTDTSTLDPGEQCEDIPRLSSLNCSSFNAFVNYAVNPLSIVTCDDCMYNLEQCLPPVPPAVCNDGKWEPLKGEECDPPGIMGTCEGFNPELFISGNVTCSNACIINLSKCVAKPIPERCGNAVIEPGEDCEPLLEMLNCDDFDNFTGGMLHCNPLTCQYDISGCDRIGVVCGDGYIDNPEQCDTDNLGNINDCTDLDPDKYIGGIPLCFPPETEKQCMLDISTCIIKAPNQTCGNGIKEGSEQCDGNNIGSMTCMLIDDYVNGTLRCNPPGSLYECMWDTSDCDKGKGFCGDNIINNFFNEECDGASPIAGDWGHVNTCIDLGFDGGDLSCNRCQFDTSLCTTPAGNGTCGDGMLNPGEDCDPGMSVKPSCNIFDHYSGGTLRCIPKGQAGQCTFDTSGCTLPITNGYCGDDIINDFPNEQCDGNAWGNIQDCYDLGFTGGTLKCNPPTASAFDRCMFNTSACTGIPAGRCGDNQLNIGEECEPNITFSVECSDFDNFTNGMLHCNPFTCKYDVSGCEVPGVVCGDGYIDGNEQCDTDNFGQISTCVQLDNTRFISGTPKCFAPGTQDACMFDTSSCIEYVGGAECGNGIKDKGEQCDGSVGDMTCKRIDGYIGGILRCSPPDSEAACQYDTRDCDLGYGYCGDNIINNFPNEDCDGIQWGKITSCQNLGFDGGFLLCNRCRFDTTFCTTPAGNGECGDKILNQGEQCEPLINLTVGCTKIDSFIGGTLSCGNDCMFDLSQCDTPSKAKCGDNIISGKEQCDGTSLSNVTKCSDYSNTFTSGSITCTSACKFNLTACVKDTSSARCGNNVTESGEECDGNVSSLLSCEDFDLKSGELRCDSNCKINTSQCDDPFTTDPVCGNTLQESGEQCDSGLQGIEEETFINLLACDNGLLCTDGCKIDCKPPPMPNFLCNNLQLDEGESDMDCGGDCPQCNDGLKCKADTDCKSGLCADGNCAANPCSNGLLDDGESDIDCGGSCEPCTEGKTCTNDNDCSSGSCVDGLCFVEPEGPEGPSTPGIITLIVGIVSLLGGGGYIVYRTYFSKAPKHPPAMASTAFPGASPEPQKPTAPAVDPKLAAMQQQKLAQKKELQDVQRRSLMKGFDGEQPASKTDIPKMQERVLQEKNIEKIKPLVQKSDRPDRPDRKQDDYLSIDELKDSKNAAVNESSGDSVFSKLSRIYSGKKESDKTAADSSEDKDSISGSKDADGSVKGDEFAEASDEDKRSNGSKEITSSKSRIKKQREKKMSSAFSELDKISADDADIKQKIMEFSGKSENKIDSLLKSDSISNDQATKVFGTLDRERLLSDPFKDILSSLISSGKLSRQTVYNILFEYMDQGILTKKDVAKIVSELKGV